MQECFMCRSNVGPQRLNGYCINCWAQRATAAEAQVDLVKQLVRMHLDTNTCTCHLRGKVTEVLAGVRQTLVAPLGGEVAVRSASPASDQSNVPPVRPKTE